MTALNEEQELISHRLDIAALGTTEIALETEILSRPAEPLAFLQLSFRVIITACSPCRARRQEMEFRAIGPHLQAGAEARAGLREIPPLDGLRRKPVVLPGGNMPGGD